jgi:hypothetical protein
MLALVQVRPRFLVLCCQIGGGAVPDRTVPDRNLFPYKPDPKFTLMVALDGNPALVLRTERGPELEVFGMFEIEHENAIFAWTDVDEVVRHRKLLPIFITAILSTQPLAFSRIELIEEHTSVSVSF